MNKATTVRLADSARADIERIQAEIGLPSWSAALAYVVRRGVQAHDADKSTKGASK